MEVQAPDREPLQRGHQESRPAQRLRARTVHVQGTITSSIAEIILGSGTFAKKDSYLHHCFLTEQTNANFLRF